MDAENSSETILPAYDSLELRCNNSCFISFYWIFRLNLSEVRDRTLIPSRSFIIALLKNHQFNCALYKQEDSAFTVLLNRDPITPDTKYMPLVLSVKIHLIDAKKSPIEIVLSGHETIAAVTYETADLTHGRESIETTWTIKFTIGVKEFKSIGNQIKWFTDEYDSADEHKPASDDVRKELIVELPENVYGFHKLKKSTSGGSKN